MSTSIPQIYIDEFNDQLRHLASQHESYLPAYITTQACNSRTYSFDRVAGKEAGEKTTRAQATPITDYDFSRRTAFAKTYDCGELIEHEDQVQAKININGGLIKEMAASMARKKDEVIIAAMGSDAVDGEGGTIALPGTQKLDESGNTITFDMVTKVQRKFLENDIMGNVQKCFVVSPAQVQKMLSMTEATSGDFVARQALQDLSAGLIVENWMGFKWIVSNQLLSPSEGNTACYAFTERAIGLAVNRDITTMGQPDPSRSYAYSLYSQSTYGAVRVEDEHIVELIVSDD